MELTPRGRNQGHVVTFERDADSFVEEDKELQSKWAAIEKLPTFKRIKTSFVDVSQEESGSSSKEADGKRVVDVTKLGAVEKRLFIDRLIKHIENDNLQLLQKLRERMERVNVKLPTVEVKYKNLNVGAECEVVQGKPLPTLWNSFSSSLSGFMKTISCNSQGAELSILNDVSGIIKPSRLTLLLGPPGCGKTTLLMALAGKLEQSLKVSGEISYNGYKLDEFVPQKTSAYISQYDLHVPEMTVRETIDFSARCQGVGSRADIVAEITRREKEEGIIPDPDIDTYMKAISVEGQSENLQTEYVLKILGLDICANILVGDALDRGISGGQKKRLTTVWPHNIASQVISKKDQRQYWYRTDIPYKYVSVDEFSQIFKSSYWGRMLNDELSQRDDKSQSHKNALSFSKYSLGKWDLFKACMKREILLMKRNSFIYVFKTAQLTITAIITMTVFLRTQMAVDLIGANYLLGSLYYTLVRLMTNGVAELIMTIARLPVVDKQKAFYLYPAWAYCLPAAILKIPFSVLDAIVWTSVTYYVIGYSPEITRQFLLLVTLHMSSTSMCRFLASVFKTDVAATTVGSLVLVLMFLFGGFILPRSSLPWWLRWGFWLSPLSYGEIGITLNEFLAPRWQKIQEGSITVGREVLSSHGLNFDSNFYWLSVGALLGFTILFDFGFVLALTYIKQPKMSRALVSKKRLSQLKGREKSNSVELKSVTVDIGHTSRENQSTGKMVLPFKPLTISFKDVQYFVDTPPNWKDTLELVRELSEPPPGSRDLHFSTSFPQNNLGQFMACLWKQHLSYWRSPEYNLTRFIFMVACAIIFGAVFWQKGNEINNQQDLFNVLGSMYIAVIFLGLNYCSTILPYVATERAVLYREKFAGMYSSMAYSLAQVAIEIPYILVQSILYVAITYPMIGFHWSVQKVFWYFYTTFCTFLYFVYLGMMIMSLSLNLDIASVLSTAVYTIFNLFSGFLMPGPKIPKWWVWCYWICPTAWSLNGFLTSQYGDMEKEILIFGKQKSVGSFLRDYYGFRHDRLSLVAVVLIVYPIVYASLFAYCIRKMNYQKR
ncbi:Pleiotropic drug resistance protein 3 [Spatholobus suberectus]|nr:Pleiotropic drug resistance protein 3 [Spatholobus suberectus]